MLVDGADRLGQHPRLMREERRHGDVYKDLLAATVVYANYSNSEHQLFVARVVLGDQFCAATLRARLIYPCRESINSVIRVSNRLNETIGHTASNRIL